MDGAGEVWQLRRGDAVIGEITVTEADFPWLRGTLTPRDGFAEVAPLFAEELALTEAFEDDNSEETIAAWEAVHDQIAATMTLAGPSGPVAEFLLHIDGTEAWFRWIDSPN